MKQVPYIFPICRPHALKELAQYTSRRHEHEWVNCEHPDRHGRINNNKQLGKNLNKQVIQQYTRQGKYVLHKRSMSVSYILSIQEQCVLTCRATVSKFIAYKLTAIM